MAKILAQAIILSSQVIARAFARAFREEYAASQAAAKRSGHGDPRVQANTNIKLGMTLDEAKDILNIKTLNEETVQKQFDHLFTVNEKSNGGSFYLQSKTTPSGLLWNRCGTSQVLYYSTFANNDIFSDFYKERFIKNSHNMKATWKIKIKGNEEAAVLVPLCKVKGKPSVLLTMRSSFVSRNKGDPSFPGGMREISDKSAVDIAIRETKEEIGLNSEVDIWTTMISFPSRTGGIKITPVVGNIGEVDLASFNINKSEVEYVFALSLEALCDPMNWHYTQYKDGYVLPVYIVNDFKVWGLTAGVLHYLLKLLLPDTYHNKFKIRSNKLKLFSKS